jgi:hypothetical protein
MAKEVEVKAEEMAADTLVDAPTDVVSAQIVSDIKAEPTDNDKEVADNTPHPALSLLDKLEAKLFFVETPIATEIKQVIEEIKSHL